MGKTKNDEIYEKGVKDGQLGGFFDDLIEGNLSAGSREGKIYKDGYTYGAQHRSGLEGSYHTSDNRGSNDSKSKFDSDKEKFGETWAKVLKEEANGESCFVASAAYGNPDHRHVQILREFRDKWLMDNQAGQTFVDFYYENSPKAAQFIEGHDYLKPAVRAVLLPIVGISWCMNAAKE